MSRPPRRRTSSLLEARRHRHGGLRSSGWVHALRASACCRSRRRRPRRARARPRRPRACARVAATRSSAWARTAAGSRRSTARTARHRRRRRPRREQPEGCAPRCRAPIVGTKAIVRPCFTRALRRRTPPSRRASLRCVASGLAGGTSAPGGSGRGMHPAAIASALAAAVARLLRSVQVTPSRRSAGGVTARRSPPPPQMTARRLPHRNECASSGKRLASRTSCT